MVSQSLEVDSHAPLHLPRIVNRSGNPAKILLLVQPQIIRASIPRIGGLEVVKDISELHYELQPNAFGNLNVLGESCVEVPAIQASEVADAPATTRIQPEHAAAKQVIDSLWIGEHVDAFRIGIPRQRRSGNDAAIRGRSNVIRPNRNRGLETAG